MRCYAIAALSVMLPTTAVGEALVAARTIPASTLIGPGDVTVSDAEFAGALRDPGAVIGREARVVLYAGRPVRAGDIGPPALIERNEIVPLSYRGGGVAISAEGRALARGAAGDTIRVMNTASRKTVSGTVTDDGTVRVNAR